MRGSRERTRSFVFWRTADSSSSASTTSPIRMNCLVGRMRCSWIPSSARRRQTGLPLNKMTNSVFTIATGSQVYLGCAINLARSFALHNDIEATSFYIVTDLQCALPEDLSFVKTMALPREVPSGGLTPKLHLDLLAPTEKALFLRDGRFVFELFNGRQVSVVGAVVVDGEWCGTPAEQLCSRFGLAGVPRFNGGLYYLERGVVATKVYENARQLQSQYDALGFHRHRAGLNEEPLLSLAMAIHSQPPLPDDGSILSGLESELKRTHIDVLHGKSVLYNPPPPSPRHVRWRNTRGAYSSAIIHFPEGFPYDREAFKLSLKFTRSLSDSAVGAAAFCRYSAPYWTTEFFKSTGRPLYRKLFGYRAVKAGRRPGSA